MTSAQKRSEYVSCMHYMIKALARVGLEARKQGISLKKLAEKYLLVNWTKATKRWCAMFVLMSDSQIDLERYIYGVICNKVNIVMTMSDKVAFELVHSFVESFWTAL